MREFLRMRIIPYLRISWIIFYPFFVWVGKKIIVLTQLSVPLRSRVPQLRNMPSGIGGGWGGGESLFFSFFYGFLGFGAPRVDLNFFPNARPRQSFPVRPSRPGDLILRFF